MSKNISMMMDIKSRIIEPSKKSVWRAVKHVKLEE